AFAVVLAALIATEFARMTRRWNELDTTQAILLINRRDPVILDVSNSTDYANGHILNAEHMPPSRIESGNSQLLKKSDRPLLVYCKNGQVSPQMATRLVKLGFEDVNVLRGGLAQWISDQQPVTRGKPGKTKSAGKHDKGDGKQDKNAGKQDKRGRKGKESKSGAATDSAAVAGGSQGESDPRSDSQSESQSESQTDSRSGSRSESESN
ncbi:MAG: rhodanese-like domain-containing protein, partial [Wenzhouxiangellaceae bacterium]